MTAASVGVDILVIVEGNLNGDRMVDIFGVMIAATEYGSEISEPEWDPLADVVQDGVVDIFDVVAAASRCGDSC
jgi:hypothetical protein